MKKTLAQRTLSLHGFYMKLGPKFGAPFFKLTAYLSLYRMFSNGGLESVAYCCYFYLIKKGEEENAAQVGLRQNKRPKRSM
jgi:hypothetical protein